METMPPLLEDAVTCLSRLPGVGRKTALRFVFHLLRSPQEQASALSESIRRLRSEIRYCKVCHNISEQEVCVICADPKRDTTKVCVVENLSDVIAFEKTGCYRGLYHVLGGLITPMEGIGPDALEIGSLIERVTDAESGISEVILALSATMEGDTTNYYIYRRLTAARSDIEITRLARGVAVGNEIEYTDHITLGQSLETRTPFKI
ncbi:MAG: recombination protein RecR [Muribaculaceae bacterium]|nr:recombination protein RecR [Muribaculaceae bacterium]